MAEVADGRVIGKKKSCTRKSLTIQEKLQLIHEQQTKGTTLRGLAAQFGIGKTQVAEVLKRKQEYVTLCSSLFQAEDDRPRLSKGLAEVNDAVFKFIKESQANLVQLTGPLIKQKAREIALAQGVENFKASNGWLSGFYKRYRVRYNYATGILEEDVPSGGAGNLDDMSLLAYSSVQVEMGNTLDPVAEDGEEDARSACDHSSMEFDLQDVSSLSNVFPDTQRGSSSQGDINDESVSGAVDNGARFSDIGGLWHIVKDVAKLVSLAVNPEALSRHRSSPSRGILLQGPSGCGKSLVVHAVANDMSLPLFKYCAAQGDSSNLQDLFSQAKTSSPSLVFLDDLDQYGSRQPILSQIVDFLDSCKDHVVILAASRHPELLDPSLRRPGRLNKEFRLGVPDLTTREKILKTLCRKIKLEAKFDWKRIAEETAGFVGADLEALVRDAIVFNGQKRSVQRHLELITTQHFLDVLKDFNPYGLGEGITTVVKGTWDQIGASFQVEQELRSSVINPLRNASRIEQFGLFPSAAVLLHGPAGCGKSLMARAVAWEAGVTFIGTTGPFILNQMLSSQIPMSAKSIRWLFNVARNSAPCVLFFDDLDVLFQEKSSGTSLLELVNQLVMELDNLENRKNVYVIGSVTRIDAVDSGLLRRNRFDKIVHVGLPSASERVDILRAITENGTKPQLGNDVSLVELGMLYQLEGYTGADLAALVKEATVQALNENSLTSNQSPLVVCHRHFQSALPNVQPSVSENV